MFRERPLLDARTTQWLSTSTRIQVPRNVPGCAVQYARKRWYGANGSLALIYAYESTAAGKSPPARNLTLFSVRSRPHANVEASEAA